MEKNIYIYYIIFIYWEIILKIHIYLIEIVVNINKHLINIIFVYLHINIKNIYIFLRKRSIRSNSLRRHLHDLFPPHSILFYRFVWKKN